MENTCKCPNCGASVKVDPNEFYSKCEYCGTEFKIHEEGKTEIISAIICGVFIVAVVIAIIFVH